MNRSSVPPPVTAGPERSRRLVARQDGGGRGAAARAGRGPRRDPGRRCAIDARSGGQATSADARPAERGPRGAEPAIRARPRSSSFTWPRSSTTTCSTRLLFGAAGRPSWHVRVARAALAVGDLLFSRAFAELGQGGEKGQVELLSEASVALALGELAQRRDSFDASISAERYLRRCELKTARLFECACLIGQTGDAAKGRSALRTFGREIGLAFQLLDDVLDVTGPPSGPARRAAPICSTAP